MPTTIETEAIEKSSFLVTAGFTGLDGAAIVPVTIVWSLVEADGTAVNSRDQVAIATPAASIGILLSGDDLAILDGKGYEERYVVLEWTFDDATYGDNLPGKDQVKFNVVNLRKVT